MNKCQKEALEPGKIVKITNQNLIFKIPNFLRKIVPKHVNILKQFMPSVLCFGVTSFLFVSYISDWRAILQYLPYYNGKYELQADETDKKMKLKNRSSTNKSDNKD